MLVQFQEVSYEGTKKRIKSSLKALLQLDKKGLSEAKINQSKEYKKFQKAMYIEKNIKSFYRNEKPTKNLINYFRKEHDYDSWVDVYIFKTNDLQTVINELESVGIEVDGSTWSSPYDCTGRAFYRGCDFIHLEDRIIVTQSGGLDV